MCRVRSNDNATVVKKLGEFKPIPNSKKIKLDIDFKVISLWSLLYIMYMGLFPNLIHLLLITCVVTYRSSTPILFTRCRKVKMMLLLRDTTMP